MRIAFIVVAVGLTTAVVPVAASAAQTDTVGVAGYQSASGGQPAMSQSLPPLQFSGAFLGLFDALKQDERAATDPVRSQFEFAINIDLEWQLSPHVRGVAQLQSGTGGATDSRFLHKDRRQRSVRQHGVCSRPYGGDIRLPGGTRRPRVGQGLL